MTDLKKKKESGKIPFDRVVKRLLETPPQSKKTSKKKRG
jgi:hypothetical protein